MNNSSYLDFGYDSFLQKTILTSPAQSPMEARASIPAGSLSSSQISSPLNPTTTIVFSSTDNNTAAWTAGVIYFADGTESQTITAGNTGNISATTYVYYDRDKSPVLQTTTTASEASGANKFMLAIVEEGASGKKCKITPTIAAGLIISGLEADQIKAGEITLSGVVTGDLDDVTDGTSYGKVLNTQITAGEIVLSAVSGDLDDITDGTSYGKVLNTQITAGEIVLSAVSGDLDDISDGSSYVKITATKEGNYDNAYTLANSVQTASYTEIAPGKVLISGSTHLDDWSSGVDATKIDGGNIYTNTITATQIAASTITATEISGTQLDVVATNTGTLDVDEYITLGNDSNVKIDGANKRILINDGTNNRIVIGDV